MQLSLLESRKVLKPPPLNKVKRAYKSRKECGEAMLEQLRLDRQRRQRADRQQIEQMERWWLKRFVETAKPLQEKMVLFWHGHFATGYRAIENSYHMFLQNNLLEIMRLAISKKTLFVKSFATQQ